MKGETAGFVLNLMKHEVTAKFALAEHWNLGFQPVGCTERLRALVAEPIPHTSPGSPK